MQTETSLVRDVLAGRKRVTVSPSDSVVDAAILMAGVGATAIPVLADNKIVGVLCDCHITQKVVAAGLNPATTAVDQVMCDQPVRISDDRDLDSAALVMSARNTRLLVVQDSFGQCLGALHAHDVCRCGCNEKNKRRNTNKEEHK
jgi:predicted transcriptional regulator